jgi:hypothetical protein
MRKLSRFCRVSRQRRPTPPAGGQAGKGRNALLAPFAFFTVFAAWEWLVTARTPEANIRVDLLLIWPAALVVVVWSLVRTLRR